MIKNELVLDFATVKLIGLILITIIFLLDIHAMYGKADYIECKNLVCTFITYNDDEFNPNRVCTVLNTNYIYENEHKILERYDIQ